MRKEEKSRKNGDVSREKEKKRSVRKKKFENQKRKKKKIKIEERNCKFGFASMFFIYFSW